MNYELTEELRVVRAKQVQRRFILFDFRESAYWLVEAIVRRIVITLAYFTPHHFSLAWLAIETMVKILLHADALAWFEDDLTTRFHRMLNAVYAIMNRRIGKALILVGIIKLDNEVTSTTIDDVFHLAPMEMHRCFLQFLDYHNLLGIRFLVNTILAVSNREEEEAASFEVA